MSRIYPRQISNKLTPFACTINPITTWSTWLYTFTSVKRLKMPTFAKSGQRGREGTRPKRCNGASEPAWLWLPRDVRITVASAGAPRRPAPWTVAWRVCRAPAMTKRVCNRARGSLSCAVRRILDEAPSSLSLRPVLFLIIKIRKFVLWIKKKKRMQIYPVTMYPLAYLPRHWRKKLET